MPKSPDNNKLDQVVANAHRNRVSREQGYRERALKMYPWICGRCEREFNRDNLRELTVHHRNHDHDYNPSDGSNWELLCHYCHDNEHSRQEEAIKAAGRTLGGNKTGDSLKQNPFADLKAMMGKKS